MRQGHRTNGSAARRFFAVLLLLTALLLASFGQSGQVFAASEAPDTQCHGVLLYDQKTGEVLYEKNADEPMTPASITKIMTAVLVLENVEDLDEEVTITEEMLFPLGNNMDLQVGEILTVRQLLNVMLVYSANDAAVALAVHVGGSEAAFVDMMNAKAAEIGAEHTHYLCPNGFSESWDHVTTPRDLKIITDYALNIDGFTDYTSQPEVTVPPTNLSGERHYKSTNQLLYDEETTIYVNGEARTPKYPGVFGVKTGMMGNAGYCLVAGCEKDDTRFVAVLLRGDDELQRFEDSIALFDWAFANYETVRLVEPGMKCGKVRVRGGHKVKVDTYCEEGILVTRDISGGTAGADENAEDGGNGEDYQIVLYDDVEAPLAAGDQVGYISYLKADGQEAQAPVTVAEDIPEGGPWTKIYISDFHFWAGLIMIAIVAVPLLLGSLAQRKQAKRRQTRSQRYAAQGGSGQYAQSRRSSRHKKKRRRR